jgi:hypothetical protein
MAWVRGVEQDIARLAGDSAAQEESAAQLCAAGRRYRCVTVVDFNRDSGVSSPGLERRHPNDRKQPMSFTVR